MKGPHPEVPGNKTITQYQNSKKKKKKNRQERKSQKKINGPYIVRRYLLALGQTTNNEKFFLYQIEKKLRRWRLCSPGKDVEIASVLCL
jgi:hypothetical protein